MRAVNLLPEDAQPRKLAAPPLAPTLGVAAAVVAVGVVGVVALGQSGVVSDRQAELASLQGQLDHVTATSGSAADSRAVSLLSTHDQRIAAVNGALGSRVAYDKGLRQLALVLPDDVWLDSLHLAAPVAAGAATTPSDGTAAIGATTIGGYTYTAAGLARLLQRLSVVPTLTDVSLTSAEVQHRGSKDVFQFSISANVRTGAS